MKFRTITQSLFSAALALCLFAPATRCQDAQSTSLEKSVDRPLNMLVLGDSIPNRQGALTYAEAIKEQLKTVYPALGSK